MSEVPLSLECPGLQICRPRGHRQVLGPCGRAYAPTGHLRDMKTHTPLTLPQNTPRDLGGSRGVGGRFLRGEVPLYRAHGSGGRGLY